MKRLFAVILAVLIAAGCVTGAAAADLDAAVTSKTVISTDEMVYEIIQNGTRWEIDEYTGEGGEVQIPGFFNGKMVVAIGDHSFANNTNVTSVLTWAPLYIIDDHAFVDCTTLQKIQLNYTTEFIGMGAFSGASALKDINLQDTIVTEISDYTFLNSGIEEVAIPSTCTKLGEYSFAQCYLLSKVVIPASVTEIAETAFDRSDNLVIYCYAGSYAEEYATAHDIPYVLIGEMMTILLGDADGDGEISILDVTVIQRVLVDIISDDDGMIALRSAMEDGEELSITDATVIQRYLAWINVYYPVDTEVTRAYVYRGGLR